MVVSLRSERSRHPPLVAGVGRAALVLWLSLVACDRGRNGPGVTTADAVGRLSVAGLLAGGDARGFERALAPRPFVFPSDHGPHPGFRQEWWYLTGNLATADGQAFGYQLTLFRSALRPRTPEVSPRPSAWATREAYMGHFAVTDVAGARFHAFDRFSRAALDLAGATTERVWLDGWTIALPSAAAPQRFEASARQGDVAVNLQLDSEKPLALQGDRGLSQKGAAAGNASYYYSATRLATTGTVTVGGRNLPVHGTSWFDREWSTSALDAGQVGWDWFALQLDDRSELMFYRLRRRDGSTDRWSGGTFVRADGSSVHVEADALTLDVLSHWSSPRDGTQYPSRWRLRVPRLGLDLEVRPKLANQELPLAVRYWEGAVEVVGTASGRSVRGAGYVELTGYTRTSEVAPSAQNR